MTEKQYRTKVAEARNKGWSDLGDCVLVRYDRGIFGYEFSLKAKDGNTIDVSWDPMKFDYLLD